jgi:hypothetical protein
VIRYFPLNDLFLCGMPKSNINSLLMSLYLTGLVIFYRGVGGGVGGGGVFVPVLIMFAGFTTKEAIPLCK